MHADIVFYTVAAVTLLSGGAAGAIAIFSKQPDPARMEVAMTLARIALIGGAALAALLESAPGP